VSEVLQEKVQGTRKRSKNLTSQGTIIEIKKMRKKTRSGERKTKHKRGHVNPKLRSNP